jgi:hypothetical protein
MDVFKTGLIISILAWVWAGQLMANNVEPTPVPIEEAHQLELLDMRIQLISSRLQTLYERFLRTPEAATLVAETTRVQTEYRIALVAAFTAAGLEPATHSINLENMTFEPMKSEPPPEEPDP